jgi:hypothetical protein
MARAAGLLKGEDFDVKNGDLRLENTYLWNTLPGISIS